MITREIDALSEWHGSEGFELLPEARRARDWLRAEREVRDLWLCADDWDGHGSPAPGAESLWSAVELLAIVRGAGGPSPSRRDALASTARGGRRRSPPRHPAGVGPAPSRPGSSARRELPHGASRYVRSMTAARSGPFQ